MTRWSQLRLRTKVFLPFSLLILATLVATLWLVNSAVSEQVAGSLRQGLRVTGRVFARVVADRAEKIEGELTLVAADFALKRAIATYDPATLASVAVNVRERIGVDLLWIVDDRGALLADSSGRAVPGREVAGLAPLALAIEDERPGAALNELDGSLFQLVAAPVFAPDPIGYLLAGAAIDDTTAARLRNETGSDVTFVSAVRLYASSWPPDVLAAMLPGGLGALATEQAAGRPFLLQRAGERFLSLLVPIESPLPRPLFALVQQSYDEALSPLRALRRKVVAIGTAALGAALFFGAALAGGIAAPLQRLVVATRAVLGGDFKRRLGIERGDEIGFLARSFDEMVAGLEEREHIKDTFGRFVSREVAAAALAGDQALAGERREVTILFQDVRGFTSIAERLEPDRLVGVVNRLMTAMVSAVEGQGGIIRQFTGDGVMALFGAPVPHVDHPARAARAALDMLARLPGLNSELAAAGLPLLRIGIGVHTGDVVVGRIGPDERVEYSVVGDAVNLASRIEGLTKELGAELLVSAATASRLGPEFRFGRRSVVEVRGKEHPVEVVEVTGCG